MKIMKNKNLEKKLRNILMNHFELNADFKKEINIKTVHQWDSFGHISLMSEIEKSFKIKLKNTLHYRLGMVRCWQNCSAFRL